MSKVRIAVDMYGGDNGISAVVCAVLSASEKLGNEVGFVLCGEQDRIIAEFLKIRPDFSFESGRFSICNSQPVSDIKTNISRIWRTQPDSSIVKCVLLQKNKEASISLSAGDTGVLYSAALFLLGRDPGIDRAALAVAIPTVRDKSTVLLDVGANAECSAKHLFQFAVLGEKYYKKIAEENKKPKIGLLNIGNETYKGTITVKYSAKMIKKKYGKQFIGFVEGGEIFEGKADVIVCDGFCGNAILKTSESLYYFIHKKIGNLLQPEAIEEMQLFNKSTYGCAPILGLRGNVFKAHGNSSADALSCAIIKAVESSVNYETDNL
ncbi:MAG: phosphate acyltransferase [Chitinispirillales bacterium]|jgi:glycerol-3-phosphate acyltransferase PlsX|nr:phosphate acyltransferase [Chitinispirillales bacterium]